MSPGVQKAWTPGVERAKWMPRSSSSSLACGSYHESAQRAAVASSPATASAIGRPSAQGRRAAALITMTPTSRSAQTARSSSAGSRYSGRDHKAG